jgi:hypothetical protein
MEGRTVRGTLEDWSTIILVTFALAVMVGVIAALALDSWWILAAPILVHGILVTVAVLVSVVGRDEELPPVPEAERLPVADELVEDARRNLPPPPRRRRG